MKDKLVSFDFADLVTAIRQAHEYMAAQAGRAVNVSLTLRNWVIGCYIREYEHIGADGPITGSKFSRPVQLTAQINNAILDNCIRQYLRFYRQF